MKKLITAIIAILYLGSSSGVAMEIHYCMGKKSGIEFYSAQSKVCGKCGMTEKKGCCHDKHQFYKIQDAHKIVSADDKADLSAPLIAFNFPAYEFHLYSTEADKVFQNHSPPQYTKPSDCIMNCVFRL